MSGVPNAKKERKNREKKLCCFIREKHINEEEI